MSSNQLNLKLLTLNTAQLPWPIGIPHRRWRAQQLVDVIQNMEEKPDIICFQEMYTYCQRSFVINKLKDQYPYQFKDTRMGAFIFGVNSGLLVLSKFPILDKLLFQYTIKLGAENLARKGVMLLKLQLAPDKTIFVGTTHQQGGDGWETWWPLDFYKCTHNEFIVKSIYVQEAMEQIINFVGTNWENEVIIYMGDFNTVNTEDAKYYEFTKFWLQARDTFDASKSKFNSSVWWRVNQGVPGRIDYIWNIGKQIPCYSVIIDDFSDQVTDHLAVFGYATV